MSLPQDMTLLPRPTPRNASVASATIAAASEIVVMTSSGAIAFGTTWLMSVPKRDLPSAREAVTKSA